VAQRNVDLQETASQLNSAAIHLLRGMRTVDRQTTLTPARLSALSVLVFGGPVTLGRLASLEGVAGPTMTRIVDGLVELGLAVRQPHPDSARLVRIAATADGEDLMQAARRRRIEALVHVLERLPASDRRRVVAAAPVLGRVAELVRAQGRSARTPLPVR
jgi:DNA-binding MarR family transcriptional regulator